MRRGGEGASDTPAGAERRRRGAERSGEQPPGAGMAGKGRAPVRERGPGSGGAPLGPLCRGGGGCSSASPRGVSFALAREWWWWWWWGMSALPQPPPQEWPLARHFSTSAFRLAKGKRSLRPPREGGDSGREGGSSGRERGYRLWNLLPTLPSLSLPPSPFPSLPSLPAEKLVAACTAGLSFLEKQFDLKG